VPPIVVGSLGFVLALANSMRVLGILLLVVSGLHLMAFPIVNFLRQAITGSTLGKSKQKIKLVVDVNGAPIGLLYALLRSGIFWFLNLISGGLFLIVDYVFPAFSPKRQRLIDKLIGTVVVNVQPPSSISEAHSPSNVTRSHLFPPPVL
jgi:uncharacterized RDD family membrane protein YckC